MEPSDHELVKVVCILRRKPNMTRKEFLDYHFQVHGKISDAPASRDDKPHKYRQYHVFDSAFGERPATEVCKLPNRNHAWVGRDDVAELYFRDMDHLRSVFSSEHVRTTVGPDGLNFSDLDTSIPWIGREVSVPIKTALSSLGAASDFDSNTAVALYFVSARNADSNSAETLTSAFRDEIETHAANDARSLTVNKSPAVLASAEDSLKAFDPNAYFGGSEMPSYPIFFKVVMKSNSSAGAIRRAQRAFEARAKDLGLDPSESFITFAKQALVSDVGVPFDGARQPRMDDLE